MKPKPTRNDVVFKFIKSFNSRHFRMPQPVEIRDACGLPSTDTALYVLKRLCIEGRLKHVRHNRYEIVKAKKE